MSNMCMMWDTLLGVPSSEDHLTISVLTIINVITDHNNIFF